MGYHLAQGIPEAGEAYTPEAWETRDGTPFREAEALEDFIFRCEVLPLCAAMNQKVAHNSLLRELFRLDGTDLGVRYMDCGKLIYYGRGQDVHAGGSGCGCSAAVLCGHLLHGMAAGTWNKLLFAATGAMMSPTTNQQGESIPAICHAVALENQRLKKEG